MAVKLRLMRVGKKKQPTYRVVVADSRSPRDGRFIEIIGQYGPRQEPSHVKLDGERALHWLHRGAQPSVQVQKLLAQTGVWERFETEKGKTVTIKPAKAHKAKAVPPAAETPPAVETPPAAVEETPPAEGTPPAEETPAAAAETPPAEAEATEESAE